MSQQLHEQCPPASAVSPRAASSDPEAHADRPYIDGRRAGHVDLHRSGSLLWISSSDHLELAGNQRKHFFLQHRRQDGDSQRRLNEIQLIFDPERISRHPRQQSRLPGQLRGRPQSGGNGSSQCNMWVHSRWNRQMTQIQSTRDWNIHTSSICVFLVQD